MSFAGSKLNTYPFLDNYSNSGFIELFSSQLDTVKLNSIKKIHSSSISDAQFVNNGGNPEIWTMSQASGGIRRFNYPGLSTETATGIGSATVSSTLNNTISGARKFRINYTTKEVAVTMFVLNVVRVYDYDTLRNGTFVQGPAGTGGHKYDIGFVSGTTWDAANTAIKNATTGRLSQPYSIEVNPVNGNWIVGCLSGFGTPTSTSSGGFIAEYNSSGVFQRIICALNGASSTGYVGVGGGQCLGDIRYNPSNNKLYASTNNGSRLLELDMTTTPISLANAFTSAPSGAPAYTGGSCFAIGLDLSNNKLLKGINGNERPIICSMSTVPLTNTINNSGDDWHFGDDYRATIAGRPYHKHSQVNNVHSIDKIGDPSGIGLGDWFVNCDYFSSSFQVFLKPTMVFASVFNMIGNYEPAYVVDVDSPVSLPAGWSVDGVSAFGFYPTNEKYIRFNPTTNKVLIHAHYITEYSGAFVINVKK